MAKQRYGINDAYRGTVGTVIGYEWRGRWCLRARPRQVRNPRTAAQQLNRQIFKAAVMLASSLQSVLRLGLRDKAVASHMTEGNRFLQLNKGLFALDGEGRLLVDYENLLVAEGPVAPVGWAAGVLPSSDIIPASDVPSRIIVPFEKNPLHLRANNDDEVYLLAVCPKAGENKLSLPVYRRTKQVSIDLPDSWQGMEVHLYGFVTSYDGRASDSMYLGSCTTVETQHAASQTDEVETQHAEILPEGSDPGEETHVGGADEAEGESLGDTRGGFVDDV